MNETVINNAVNKFVDDFLSPKPAERAYIDSKYKEVRVLLEWKCFRTGSYARLTANHPVHDLDVIYVVDDPVHQDDPVAYVNELKKRIESSQITGMKKVSVQSHSLTIEFTDSKTDFTMDIVPVIETNELNEFGDSLYIVPEILQLNEYRRMKRYASAGARPIEWIKSDPKGYIHAARVLNDSNTDFRPSVRLGKGWRYACKLVYGDEFRLKSFHFELIFYRFFKNYPKANSIEAIIECIGQITSSIDVPVFEDRADSTRYVDDYVKDITPAQRELIKRLQATADSVVERLPYSKSPGEVQTLLNELISIKKPSSVLRPLAVATPATHKPWAQ